MTSGESPRPSPRGVAALVAVAFLAGVLAAASPAAGARLASSREVLAQTRSWNANLEVVALQERHHPSRFSLVLGVGQRLFHVAGAASNWRLQETFLAPREVTGGVALSDVTGDGRINLALGSDGPGAVYVYRRGEPGWSLVARTDYTWSPVNAVQVAHITGDQRADMLVTTQDQRVYLFSWAFGEFLTRWHSGEEGYWFAQAADLDGDGRHEVVLVRREGYVGIWRWEESGLVPAWENYPWGTIAAVTLDDADGDGLPDVVLNTSRRLLYVFGWSRDGYQLKYQLSHPDLPFSWLAVSPGAAQAAPGEPTLLASDGGLLRWYRLRPSGLELRWSTSRPRRVKGLWSVPGQRSFLLWDEEALRLLEPVPESAWRLDWQGEERAMQYPPLVHEGVLYVSAQDVADWVGWQLYWDREEQRLTALGLRSFLVGKLGESAVYTHRGRVELSGALEMREGRVYLPFDVLIVMGFEVEWDELTRSLTVR